MALPAIKKDRVYTYGDYRTWPDDERWELIDGTAWNMSPAPSRWHQEIISQLMRPILIYLQNRPCRVYTAPFDVLFPSFGEEQEDDVTTVVQPDISVICDRSKLTDKGCTGAPEWIIEILSPFTSRKDMAIKFELYERHGVQEYWIVDPAAKYIHVYAMDEKGKYPENPIIYLQDGIISCIVLQGLSIDLKRIFAEE
jgi:Uma2 family endonuclease